MTLTASFTSASLGDFSVAVSPVSITAERGDTIVVAAHIVSVGGFSGQVSLFAGGVPVGVSCRFSPPTVTAPDFSSLICDIASSAPLGTYILTVTGVNESLMHEATLQLIIEETTKGPGSDIWAWFLPVVIVIVVFVVLALLILAKRHKKDGDAA